MNGSLFCLSAQGCICIHQCTGYMQYCPGNGFPTIPGLSMAVMSRKIQLDANKSMEGEDGKQALSSVCVFGFLTTEVCMCSHV